MVEFLNVLHLSKYTIQKNQIFIACYITIFHDV